MEVYFDRIIQEIDHLKESEDTKYTPISLLDPNLSFEELERKQILYTYSQAQMDNREAEFKEYEEKYTQVFQIYMICTMSVSYLILLSGLLMIMLLL